jgi:hypothetical protein
VKRRSFEPTAHDIEAEGLPSASGFDSEFRCLGKRALCSQLPKEEDTVIQARGHRIHKSLEESDLSDLPLSEERTASRIMYGEAKLVHEYDFEGAEVEFEQRVWDIDDDWNHTWSARIDSVHWQPNKRRLLIPDYKSGWSLPPPIEINWQVRSSAALLAEYHDAEEAVCALIHPHHADSLYEVAVFTRQDLRGLLDTTRHNVAAIQLPDQPRTPGGIQCQWCTAKGICPEYKAQLAKTEQEIADEIEDQGFTAVIRRTPNERGDHVRRIHEVVKNAEAMLAQYVKLAERDGSAVDGYTVKRNLRRSLTNEAQAMEIVRSTFGEAALYDALHLSLTDLEKKIAATTTMKDAKAAVQRALNPVLKFTKTKSFLVESRTP